MRRHQREAPPPSVMFCGRKWTYTSTGGDCTAYETAIAEDGTYWLATAPDAPKAPRPGERALICQYSTEHDEPLETYEAYWTPEA